MQQEAVDREETVMDLEGGSLKEEGLEDLIAALRQRNSAGQRQQQQQQQPAAAAAGGEDGLFWDYTGANAVNSNAVKPTPAPAAVPVPLPRAAVAAAAAAAQPRLAAPTAAAPPALATPWARAAASGAASLKAPPPGSQPAAAPSSKPSAAAVVGRGANQPAAPPRAAAGSGVPGAIYQEPAPAPRRQAAAAPVPAAAPAANNSSEPVLFGGLELSPAFAQWCKGQMQQLNGNDDMTMVEFLMGLTSNSEIAEYCQMVWPNKPGRIWICCTLQWHSCSLQICVLRCCEAWLAAAVCSSCVLLYCTQSLWCMACLWICLSSAVAAVACRGVYLCQRVRQAQGGRAEPQARRQKEEGR